jgi:hypothetical protein
MEDDDGGGGGGAPPPASLSSNVILFGMEIPTVLRCFPRMFVILFVAFFVG